MKKFFFATFLLVSSASAQTPTGYSDWDYIQFARHKDGYTVFVFENPQYHGQACANEPSRRFIVRWENGPPFLSTWNGKLLHEKRKIAFFGCHDDPQGNALPLGIWASE